MKPPSAAIVAPQAGWRPERALLDAKPNETPFPPLPAADASHAAINCAFGDEHRGLWLHQSDCLAFMDALLKRHADGLFDMAFADPPYFCGSGVRRVRLLQVQPVLGGEASGAGGGGAIVLRQGG